MKTLNLLATVLALNVAAAHADGGAQNMRAGQDQAGASSARPTTPGWGEPQAASEWFPVTWAVTGGGERQFWVHSSDMPQGLDVLNKDVMPLYELTCTAGRCLSTRSVYTLSKTWSFLSGGEYQVNVPGSDTQVSAVIPHETDRPGLRALLTAGDDGQVTVLDPEASIAARAEAEALAAAAAAAPAAAGADVLTNADEAAVGDILSGAEDMLADADGDNSGLDNSNAAGVDGTNTGNAAAATLTGTDGAPTVDGGAVPAPVTDLQTPAPPTPERVPVTRRGLSMPDRIASGVGLGWLGMILAVAASATPLGVAAAALTLGGAGFGLATFFGSHEA